MVKINKNYYGSSESAIAGKEAERDYNERLFLHEALRQHQLSAWTNRRIRRSSAETPPNRFFAFGNS